MASISAPSKAVLRLCLTPGRSVTARGASRCALKPQHLTGPGLQQPSHCSLCGKRQRSSSTWPIVGPVKRLQVCFAAQVQTATRQAEPGDFVKVFYTGTLEDGSVFDSNVDQDPLQFEIGAGKVIPGFDDAVTGLAEGEKRKQHVPADRAYGEWREDMTAKVPTEDAPQELKQGVQVQLSNGLTAKVTEVTPEHVLIDANHALAGKDLTFDVELVHLQKPSSLKQATFAAGCFWGLELAFQRIPGVVSTSVGYSNGDYADPTYDAVCSGTTGHAEAVQVTYDPSDTDYKQLVKTFLKEHDPTLLNRQGGDSGTQYRSGIYFHSDEQRQIAERVIQEAASDYQDPIVTELADVKDFTPAEDYHQQYLEKGGRFGKAQNATKGCDDPIRCYG